MRSISFDTIDSEKWAQFLEVAADKLQNPEKNEYGLYHQGNELILLKIKNLNKNNLEHPINEQLLSQHLWNVFSRMEYVDQTLRAIKAINIITSKNLFIQPSTLSKWIFKPLYLLGLANCFGMIQFYHLPYMFEYEVTRVVAQCYEALSSCLENSSEEYISSFQKGMSEAKKVWMVTHPDKTKGKELSLKDISFMQAYEKIQELFKKYGTNPKELDSLRELF